ncbi:Serpentine receptor class gamma [Balamuthia mandrillaris]
MTGFKTTTVTEEATTVVPTPEAAFHPSSLKLRPVAGGLKLSSETKTKQPQPQQTEPVSPSYAATKTWKKPANTQHWFFRLFFQKKFMVHRLGGLLYLTQFALACLLYTFNYPLFISSPLVWSLPLTGLLQAVSAMLTFTFLPKSDDPGYVAFSDKTPMSYFFIVENSFFELLLLYQWLYYCDTFTPFIRDSIVLEVAFVFLPYYMRTFWPKTSIRNALKNSAKNKSDKNRFFFTVSSYIVKMFYMWAKHTIGFLFNYVRFMDRVTPEEQAVMYGVLITGGYAATISLFLHTLKFKGYISARTATILYEGSYIVMAYFFWHLRSVFIANWHIAALTYAGMLLNYLPPKYKAWHIWQMLMLILFFAWRFDVSAHVPESWVPYLPSNPESPIFLGYPYSHPNATVA